jgi:hypothetical protein
MKITAREMEAVLALPGEKRYEYFIKRIADTETIWGLYRDGWALAANDKGAQVFPMWPAREYAALCAVDEWEGYEPRDFSIEDLMDELIPRFRTDGTLPGIFYTPKDKGVTPPIEVFERDILEELRKY